MKAFWQVFTLSILFLMVMGSAHANDCDDSLASTDEIVAQVEEKLIERLGVPSDTLGEPELHSSDERVMLELTHGLSADALIKLQEKANARVFSDFRTREKILAENFERKLSELLQLQIVAAKIKTAADAESALRLYLGVEPDLMGEPELTETAELTMEILVSHLDLSELDELFGAVKRKRLSNWKLRSPYLPASFERKLKHILSVKIEIMVAALLSKKEPSLSDEAKTTIINYIRDNAKKDGLFPYLSRGNAGLRAYIIDSASLNAMLAVVKATRTPQVDPNPVQMNVETEKLIAILITDDEPKIELLVYNVVTGEFTKPLVCIRVMEAPDEDKILEALDANQKEWSGNYDGFKVVYMLLKDSEELILGTEDEGIRRDWSIHAYNPDADL